MGKKGLVTPDLIMKALTDNGKPRCQRVRRILDEEGNELPGIQCKKMAIPGRPFCRYHGGKAGGPLTAGGRYSKYYILPKNLQSRFEESRKNPDLLNLTNSIALLDSQIWQIGEDASTQDNFTPLQRKQLTILIKEHRELVSAETDRRIAMGALMDIGEVMRIINFIYDSILRNVKSVEERGRISLDLRKIVSGELKGQDANDLGSTENQNDEEDEESGEDDDISEGTIIDAEIHESQHEVSAGGSGPSPADASDASG